MYSLILGIYIYLMVLYILTAFCWLLLAALLDPTKYLPWGTAIVALIGECWNLACRLRKRREWRRRNSSIWCFMGLGSCGFLDIQATHRCSKQAKGWNPPAYQPKYSCNSCGKHNCLHERTLWMDLKQSDQCRNDNYRLKGMERPLKTTMFLRLILHTSRFRFNQHQWKM